VEKTNFQQKRALSSVAHWDFPHRYPTRYCKNSEIPTKLDTFSNPHFIFSNAYSPSELHGVAFPSKEPFVIRTDVYNFGSCSDWRSEPFRKNMGFEDVRSFSSNKVTVCRCGTRVQGTRAQVSAGKRWDDLGRFHYLDIQTVMQGQKPPRQGLGVST
jgi:hypothetical protein